MELILTTREELTSVVQDALMQFIANYKPVQHNTVKLLNFAEASEFLTENGYKVSSSRLSNFVHKEAIPFRKFGRRVQFDQEELLSWAKSNSKQQYSSTIQKDLITKSANKKKNFTHK